MIVLVIYFCVMNASKTMASKGNNHFIINSYGSGSCLDSSFCYCGSHSVRQQMGCLRFEVILRFAHVSGG